MPLCMFRYAFEFNIPLPEGYVLRVNYGGCEALIRCISLDGDKLFSFKPNDYQWLAKNEGILEARIFSHNKDGQQLIARKTRYYENKGVFSGGIIDPVKYTIVEVVFEIESSDSLNDKHFHEETIIRANNILIYFIDAYRVVSQNKSVHRPSINNSPAIEFCVSEIGTINEPQIDIGFDCRPATFTWSDPFKKGYARKTLSNEKTNILAQMLKAGRKLRIFEQLLLVLLQLNYRAS